ncbi:50S ribosomal protein L11 methyltransferase [Sphingobacterium daejeonense]|uniref:50S ribosomal protein L11 methyltransferase n=1 Tax=Sphingobacterium daejeonense TaxID=371142 RepID=UPI001E321560|nr:50S ribosomal protein L11 methyltransferase [Sphingobacterium daejeonense]
METVLATEAVGYDISYQVEELENKNWNQVWESNFSPILVDDQCYVRATFHEDKPEYPYQIIIDPKNVIWYRPSPKPLSMMLSFILENNFEGKQVLDMGCGTGILAILASKRGAKDILAVDFDPICVESVNENKELNQVSNIEAKFGIQRSNSRSSI